MNRLKKILTIGIIILLVGVSYSSAISVDSITPIINQQNDEDYKCNEIDNKYLIKLKNQLNRLEVYSKLLVMLSRHNHKLATEYEELSIDITTLSWIYEELEISLTINDRLICILLEDLMIHLANMFWYYYELILKNIDEPRFIHGLLAWMYFEFSIGVGIIMIKLDCELPDIPQYIFR